MFWHCEKKNAPCIPISDWVSGAEPQDLFHLHLRSIPVLVMLGVALSMAQRSGSSSGLPLPHGGKKLEPSHCAVAVTEEGRWVA